MVVERKPLLRLGENRQHKGMRGFRRFLMWRVMEMTGLCSESFKAASPASTRSSEMSAPSRRQRRSSNAGTRKKPDAVIADGYGLGAGVVDQLQYRGYGQRAGLYEFHGGARPKMSQVLQPSSGSLGFSCPVAQS